MGSRTITIRVEDDAARAYEEASHEDRRKLEVLLSLKLVEATHPGRSLEEILSEVGRKAQERGLTQEILESILDDES
jgi:hypothetical protein